MTAHWRSRAGLLVILLGAGVLPGCVERRYTVLTDPPTAMVLEDGRPKGSSPTTQPFDFYGVHKFTLMRDGCQPVDVYENICAPWWAYPPFDFITENVLPFTIRDLREYRYDLLTMQVIPAEQARDRALELRGRAIQLVPPQPPVLEGPPPSVLPQVSPPVQEGPKPKILPPPG